MATFVENFMCRTAMELKFPSFWVPWIKKHIVSRGRGYSSSFPVRYSPKTTSTPKNAQTFAPKEISEDNEKHNFTDRNVFKDNFLDGSKKLKRGFGSGSSSKPKEQNQRDINKLSINLKQEMEEEIDYDLVSEDCETMKGPGEVVQEFRIHLNDSDEGIGICAGKTKDVEIVATKLLATRAFTAFELRKKLEGKRFPVDLVNAVIRDFQRRGFINDCLYAEMFSQSRWSSLSWGPRRIKQALLKKGISMVDAEKAIQMVFEDDKASVNQDLIHGLSKFSMDHLIIKVSKQWLRGNDISRDDRKSRIIRWLQYRGFNWGVICFLLRKLESDYPP